MVGRERIALGVVLSAVALGVLGDYLFQGHTLGVNAGIFALAFVAALSLLLRLGRIPLHQGRRAMAAPLLLFAGLLAWHDSPLLLATNLLAVQLTILDSVRTRWWLRNLISRAASSTARPTQTLLS